MRQGDDAGRGPTLAGSTRAAALPHDTAERRVLPTLLPPPGTIAAWRRSSPVFVGCSAAGSTRS
jgi:hypothetical protein